MTTRLPGIELKLNQAAIYSALAALREGRSTGDATLDQVVNTLGRHQARAWAQFRRARPDVSEADIDVAADRAVDWLASEPAVVALLLVVDAAICAAMGGAS